MDFRFRCTDFSQMPGAVLSAQHILDGTASARDWFPAPKEPLVSVGICHYFLGRPQILMGDPLFSPFTIKKLTLRNRIVSTSHEPAYSEDGLPKDRYRAYHREKARGGVALTMIGGSAVVSRESTPAFGNLQLWKDESVPWLRRLADEVHEP